MIGYYAHGHGSGHCNFADIFGHVFGQDMMVFTDRKHSFDSSVRVVHLPNENTDGSEFERECFPEPCALHYAPVNLRKITERNEIILSNVIQCGIKLMIIDLSVEIAMLARVSSVPYAYVRLMGERNDLPHVAAFQGASFLLAYFPEELEPNQTPDWVRRKTIYLGFITTFMFDRTEPLFPNEFRDAHKPVLVKVNGFGGSDLIDISTLGNDFKLFTIGPTLTSCSSKIGNIGVVPSIRPYLRHADIVIAACGLNMTSEILYSRKRFIAVPEDRHFGEQRMMAERLSVLGHAIDVTKCSGIAEAVDILVNNRKSEMPSFSNDRLLQFKSRMRNVSFRADELVLQYGLNSTIRTEILNINR